MVEIEKIKSFIKKDESRFYKLAFVVSLLVIVSLALSLLKVDKMDKKRMIFATDRYMTSLKYFSYWTKVYLEDPSNEDLNGSLEHMSYNMDYYMSTAYPSKGSDYLDLRESLSKLAQLNYLLSIQHFPKADDQDESLKIQKLIQDYEDLVRYYSDSDNMGFHPNRFENYKDLVEKVEDLNQSIIKDFGIKESDL